MAWGDYGGVWPASGPLVAWANWHEVLSAINERFAVVAMHLRDEWNLQGNQNDLYQFVPVERMAALRGIPRYTGNAVAPEMPRYFRRLAAGFPEPPFYDLFRAVDYAFHLFIRGAAERRGGTFFNRSRMSRGFADLQGVGDTGDLCASGNSFHLLTNYEAFMVATLGRPRFYPAGPPMNALPIVGSVQYLNDAKTVLDALSVALTDHRPGEFINSSWPVVRRRFASVNANVDTLPTSESELRAAFLAAADETFMNEWPLEKYIRVGARRLTISALSTAPRTMENTGVLSPDLVVDWYARNVTPGLDEGWTFDPVGLPISPIVGNWSRVLTARPIRGDLMSLDDALALPDSFPSTPETGSRTLGFVTEEPNQCAVRGFRFGREWSDV